MTRWRPILALIVLCAGCGEVVEAQSDASTVVDGGTADAVPPIDALANVCTVGGDECSPFANCESVGGALSCVCDAGLDGDGLGDEGCCVSPSAYVVGVDTVQQLGGLTWTRDFAPGVYTHAEATAYCAANAVRLPTIAELESLVDLTWVPTFEPCTFRPDVSTIAWSSTDVGGNSAFVVDFGFGGTGNDVKTNSKGVLCIR